MASTLLAKLAGGVAVAAIALSSLVAPGTASASAGRIHQTTASVYSVASQRAAAHRAAAVAKMRYLHAHKVAGAKLHAERQRMLRAAAARRAAVAAHRRRAVASRIAYNRAHKRH